jgi:hypothetical protein
MLKATMLSLEYSQKILRDNRESLEIMLKYSLRIAKSVASGARGM